MGEYNTQQQKNNVDDDEIIIDISQLFADMMKGFKKMWWMVLIICGGMAAILCGISAVRYTPKYEARSSFTVSTLNGASDIDSSYGYDYTTRATFQLTDLFPYILDSDILKDLLKESLGTDEINGEMNVSSVADSNLFTISVISDSADEAGKILEAVMMHIPEVSRYVIGETKLNIIQQVRVSNEPCNEPDYRRLICMGILIGIMAGAAILLVYALMRRTIHNQEELTEQLNLSCLGTIPQIKNTKNKRKTGSMLSILNKRTGWQFLESVRGLCLKVERRMYEKEEKILMITSTLPEEGKSMTAMNLALALGTKGKKVLLIDMDLRNPSLYKALKAPAETASLVQVLEGKKKADEVIGQLNSGIYFLGAAKSIRHPPALLTSPAFGKILQEYREKMDYIIVDTPPCGIVSDAATISESCEAILYVIRQDTAKQTAILDGIQRVASHGKHVIGGVFNGTNEMSSGYGYGHYGYGKYGYGKYGKYGDSRYGNKKTEGKKA